MIQVNAVIFDLDGTLIQSKIDYEEMRRRVMEVLIESGIRAEKLSQSGRVWELMKGGEELQRKSGLSLNSILKVRQRITEALNSVELEGVEKVKPTPHALEVLEKLRGRGLSVGVATRSCNAYATRALELTGLTRYVNVLFARDDVEYPKPDPRHLMKVVEALGASPHSVVFIGDTTTDLETANEAGIKFIGYIREDEWGKRLREAKCELLIDDLRTIIHLIK